MTINYSTREEITEIDKRAADLLEAYDRIVRFGVNNMVVPPQSKESVNAAYRLEDRIREISEIKYLSRYEEILLREIGRNVSRVRMDLELMPKRSNLDAAELIGIYSVPIGDLENLGTWLKYNQDSIRSSIATEFEESDKFGADHTIPQNRIFMEEEGGKIIKKFHDTTNDISMKTSGIEIDEIKAFPAWDRGGQYNYKDKTIKIGLPFIFISDNGSIKTHYATLLHLFGHEAYGHGRNFIHSEKSDIPQVLKKDVLWKESTIESIAQYFTGVYMDDIKNRPDTQEKLGIEDFDKVYEEFKKHEMFDMFNKNRNAYLAYLISKKLPKENIIEAVNQVAQNNLFAPLKIEEFTNRNGELCLSLVKDLLIHVGQSAEKSVNRIKKELGKNWFEKNRTEVDRFLLTGLWTPEGYKEMTELFIEQNK